MSNEGITHITDTSTFIDNTITINTIKFNMINISDIVMYKISILIYDNIDSSMSNDDSNAMNRYLQRFFEGSQDPFGYYQYLMVEVNTKVY